MSGLKFGKKYKYRVIAENAAGQSDPSNTVGPVLADDPHCKYRTVSKIYYIFFTVEYFKCCY